MTETPRDDLARIKALQPILCDKAAGHWKAADTVAKSYQSILDHWQEDSAMLRSWLVVCVSPDQAIAESTSEIEDFLTHIMYDRGPSLTALASYAIDKMGLDLAPDLHQALLLSAMLGDVENNPAYHNNQHYLKVLLQAIRLLIVHEDLFNGTKQALSDEQAALVMIAACIHDLGHDGTGNTVKGVFQPSRLELQSVQLAEPYLKAVGMSDADLAALSSMIISTDVTPLADPANPMNQMKSAYRFHYRGDKSKTDSLHLDAALEALQQDKKLSLMALMLHEADMATSAGISYIITQHETVLYRQEVAGDKARPSHIVDFIEAICQQQFLSDAGQHLYGANLARIYAHALDDEQNDDQPYVLGPNAQADLNTKPPHKTIN